LLHSRPSTIGANENGRKKREDGCRYQQAIWADLNASMEPVHPGKCWSGPGGRVRARRVAILSALTAGAAASSVTWPRVAGISSWMFLFVGYGVCFRGASDARQIDSGVPGLKTSSRLTYRVVPWRPRRKKFGVLYLTRKGQSIVWRRCASPAPAARGQGSFTTPLVASLRAASWREAEQGSPFYEPVDPRIEKTCLRRQCARPNFSDQQTCGRTSRSQRGHHQFRCTSKIRAPISCNRCTIAVLPMSQKGAPAAGGIWGHGPCTLGINPPTLDAAPDVAIEPAGQEI